MSYIFTIVMFFFLLVINSNAQVKVSSAFSAAVTVPSGEYSDYFSSGAGVYLDVSFSPVFTPFTFTLSGGFLYSEISKPGIERDALNYLGVSSDEFTPPASSYINFPVMIKARYNTTPFNIKPFFEIEGGINAILSEEINILYSNAGTVASTKKQEMFIKPAYSLGMGVEFLMSRETSLEFLVKYFLTGYESKRYFTSEPAGIVHDGSVEENGGQMIFSVAFRVKF
ncbi:MAG: hypothetical protein IAE91_02865 [Ignavibacteriaceae bacterium]|nr:hypothetical protein [Ignavibacteriaceae bacterium]